MMPKHHSSVMQSALMARSPRCGQGPLFRQVLVLRENCSHCGLDYAFIELGEAAYRKGHTSGIPGEAWGLLRETGSLLKGPTFAPRWVGGAMAACPDDVPWQRVINSQGKVSERAGAQKQRQLLEAEGIIFDAKDRVDLKKNGWSGKDEDIPQQPSLF